MAALVTDPPVTRPRPPSRREQRIGTALAAGVVLSALTVPVLALACDGNEPAGPSKIAPAPPTNLARGAAFSP